MSADSSGPSQFDARFEMLINAVTDYAIYMLDPTGMIVSWNPGARRFKGYEADEIIGQNFARFFTPEDLEAGLPQRALATAAREGRFEAEGWRVRKDGTRFWANAVVDAIRDDKGELVGFAKITRDISEKKAAEVALHASEQRFRLLVESVRDYAIYMLDPEGHVTNWNAGAERIKGYRADEIIGQHFSRFYTEQDRANGEPQRALETALREGKFEAEVRRVRKDGTLFWANVLIDPIRDETGRLIGFAKVTRDVTDRKEAELSLEETRAALYQSQKLQALGELTGGIAHDFNNLITVIRGSAELLARDDLPHERRRRYLDAIIETADRASTLTSHLLAFGRRQALTLEVIDLNVRLDAFSEMLQRTLGGTIEVALDLAPSLWLTEVDLTQLETALLNASLNARDAMPEGGRILFRTRNMAEGQNEFVVVEVQDSGSGMPAEVVERAFEPFFTTKPVGKGTGLGLSQIHGFAAQSGGRAEIDSVAGRGTTIRLLLPRTHKPLAGDRAESASAAESLHLSIMLVEDNAHVREFATDLLAELGHTVIPASDADEALQLLETHEVDLLFSDVVMPGWSGVELARQVRAADPDMPILLASGYSEEILRGAADEFELIGKPYGLDALRTAIEAAVARGR